jgi:hypothetical protein
MSYDLDKAVQSALAGVVGGRVYPDRLADAPAYPAIVFSTPGTRPDSTLAGQSTLTYFRYRFDLYATTRKELQQMRATVLGIMRRFSYLNIPVSDFSGYEPTKDIYRRTMDFSISEHLPKSSAARKTPHAAPST